MPLCAYKRATCPLLVDQLVMRLAACCHRSASFIAQMEVGSLELPTSILLFNGVLLHIWELRGLVIRQVDRLAH